MMHHLCQLFLIVIGIALWITADRMAADFASGARIGQMIVYGFSLLCFATAIMWFLLGGILDF